MPAELRGKEGRRGEGQKMVKTVVVGFRNEILRRRSSVTALGIHNTSFIEENSP